MGALEIFTSSLPRRSSGSFVSPALYQIIGTVSIIYGQEFPDFLGDMIVHEQNAHLCTGEFGKGALSADLNFFELTVPVFVEKAVVAERSLLEKWGTHRG
jgi:hypothetical protein